MHFTCGMRMANVGYNPELVDRKVAPALEVVTHCGLNGKLSFAEFFALYIFSSLDLLIVEQFHNHHATFTIFLAAILVTGYQNNICVKVIPRNLIYCFAL